MDKGSSFGALPADLSKAFVYLLHDLLIAKLHAYGFDIPFLKLVRIQKISRIQRVKINDKFCSREEIVIGVTQESILGPLHFNMLLCYLFIFTNGSDISN